MTSGRLGGPQASSGIEVIGSIYAVIMQAPKILREARTRAGLSGRTLAQRAGVAHSTVVRIEAGQVDPTTGMLQRLLAAAGHRLVLGVDSSRMPELADLATAWRRAPDQQIRPDWTSLRSFVDAITRMPEGSAWAIARPPAPSGSEVVDNLLAGIAEKVADDAGIARPDWTLEVVPLYDPWFTPSTPHMRNAARARTPSQLAQRNIWVSNETLWRPTTTVRT